MQTHNLFNMPSH